ncbi:alpha/beta hydrolase [Anabaena sp. FACHB-1237]|uniref:alpha/beta fold hydrolase n=1 Tax=Anabaena sp. FACHB-1237 TaxID=2692769 RepID=UPI001681904C|nr:alpha/beta hydrolase [Anabaena sp. FACHB-1237]MBD2137810.1 alpha/beta hydrolase [Anabaena sp. FACHB-1237]
MSKFADQPYFFTPQTVNLQYPLLIYLPGMDGSGKLFTRQIPDLSKFFDIRCLVIPTNNNSGWDDLTTDVLNLIHAELEKSSFRPVYLCGESFGGCLGLKIACKSQNLFKRIILVNPASVFSLLPWFSLLTDACQFVPSFLFDVGALGLLPLLANLEKIEASDRQNLLNAMRLLPPEIINHRLCMLRDFKISEVELKKIEQPVLLIGSESDRLSPSLSEVERLNQILPNTQKFILPNSGHACLLETQVNLYQILIEHSFLTSEQPQQMLELTSSITDFLKNSGI